MSSDANASASQLLFQRVKVSAADERIFVIKLLAAGCLWAAGAVLALAGGWWPVRVAGVVLVGLMYTHWVELQHQCLHHSAFRSPRWHRLVGVPLGVPMLVSYSHYRVRHLQHHRYLGTDKDSEFFGFATRQKLTWGVLVRECFAFGRMGAALMDVVRCWRGGWEYGMGQIAEARKREIVGEYRMFALPVVAAVVLCALGYGEPVLWLWLLPLLVAVPAHFLVELPEHVLCDNWSTDVLLNTRSITGSRFSTWFTNGNNLHIEHHAAMVVPINRLRERHSTTLELAKHTSRTYPKFYWAVIKEAHANSRVARSPERGADE